MGVDLAAQLVYGIEIDASDTTPAYLWEGCYVAWEDKNPGAQPPFVLTALGDSYGGNETWVLSHKDDAFEAGRYSKIPEGEVGRPRFTETFTNTLLAWAAAVDLKPVGAPGFFFAMGLS